MKAESTDTTGIDDQALAMRGQGQGFAAIAKALGMGKATEANVAFNRALRRRPATEQARIRKQEHRRLDKMVERIHADSESGEELAGKRLRAIERIRILLMAD